MFGMYFAQPYFAYGAGTASVVTSTLRFIHCATRALAGFRRSTRKEV